MYKLIFKTEADMLLALVGCKFCQIPTETEYDDEQKGDLDVLSFDMKEGVE